MKVYLNQVGFYPEDDKRAVFDHDAKEYDVVDEKGNSVFHGSVSHFGTDEISGDDTYTADFSALKTEGKYRIKSGDVISSAFTVSSNVYDKLMKDICKCFYYLRCGDALDKEYAGVYYHEPCHMTKAAIYNPDFDPGDEKDMIDVSGGWHDAGDFGRYSTAGAVALAHLLYGIRFFDNLLDVEFDIPKVKCERNDRNQSSGKDATLPDILAEAKVELDFLLKMQREDGGVWHKVTTQYHAPFQMPEDDHGQLFLYNVSSMATADMAAICALAYTVYVNYDKIYADRLLAAAHRSYEWLNNNQDSVLFSNPANSGTGDYTEAEDISNRYWAAASMYETTGDKKYLEDASKYKAELEDFDKKAKNSGNHGYISAKAGCLVGMGWAEVGGLGSLSLLLKKEDNELTSDIRKAFCEEADRLCKSAAKNGFMLCMDKDDFIWGSNMELLKYLMILTVTDKTDPDPKYKPVIRAGIDYLLGCNSMDTSYVTGNGDKAYKHPHLRPTATDGIDEPWPGLVSGGPNRGLQDERASKLPKDLPPMKCYLDHEDCYSLNEITIYWNSPLVFVLAGIMNGGR
ncbi:MAG: glycoside hydrolase family 9 protein [Lachnospiraceae bacterium]|nr:glycoside hydrolase family 9 protein [Lachnospiraceae bacterium]